MACSNYLISRNPYFYGNQQGNYLQNVEEIVAKTTQSFSESVNRKDDLIALFHSTLAFMGERRKEIAQQHKTEDATLFGDFQTDNELKSFCIFTPMDARYTDYGRKILDCFYKHLSSMKHSMVKFDEKTKSILGEKCLDRRSQLDIQIFTLENQIDWRVEFTKESYLKICKLSSTKPVENVNSLTDDKIVELLSDLMANKEAMKTLKQNSIEDYKKLKQTAFLPNMFNVLRSLNWAASDWAIITRRLEVDGKMYALSQYVTTMLRDGKGDPVTTMKEKSKAYILHQDFFLRDTMLNDIAKIFKEAIEWTKDQDIQILKDKVALLVYEFAHTMPFIRGSAAISEWLEMAIYRYHGFNLSYSDKNNENLEALTSSLKEFIEKYNSIVNLEPISS